MKRVYRSKSHVPMCYFIYITSKTAAVDVYPLFYRVKNSFV